jgi:hypothetical protein
MVLDSDQYQKKGQFMKQSAWFSLLALIDRYDHVWHCHRYMAQIVADSFMKGREGKAVVTELVKPRVSASDAGKPGQESTKESYMAELRKLRKQAGNAMLLAPSLMSDNNLVNARILLLVGRPAWSEQTLKSCAKTTPDAEELLATKLASGLGEELVRTPGVSAWNQN